MGIFAGFENDSSVKLTGVEAGGQGISTGQHAASICGGRVGVLHGCKTYLLQDDEGQILDTFSISAGLDYPGVGPEHSFFADTGKAHYAVINDKEAVEAFFLLSRLEGIIPYAIQFASKYSNEDIVLVNLSGRGDKDINSVKDFMLKNNRK